MAVFRIEAKEFDRLQKAIKNFPGDAEEAINEILHNEGSELIQKSIKNLIKNMGRFLSPFAVLHYLYQA